MLFYCSAGLRLVVSLTEIIRFSSICFCICFNLLCQRLRPAQVGAHSRVVGLPFFSFSF